MVATGNETVDQPWTAREDWRAGRITGQGRSQTVFFWVFALIWNAGTWPMAWLIVSQQTDNRAYLVLTFPLVGIGLLVAAVRGTLRNRKYGQSHFVLETNPGVIGRTLAGRVETSLQTVPEAGVDVRLSCIRRYETGTGKNRSTSHTTLWQDATTMSGADLGRGLKGLTVPVVFEIPSNARACDDTNPRDQILWSLTVAASTPGVDYSDSFDVPVFDTGAEPLNAAERDALRARRVSEARSDPPKNPVVRVARTTHGGTVFSGKPPATLGSSIRIVLLTSAAWAGTVYLFMKEVPIAPFAVGIFALLFTAGMLIALFHRWSITIENDQVVIRHRVLGIGPTRQLRVAEIVDVRSEVVGEGKAQTWEVKIYTSAGNSHSAAAHLPTQREADWTADQIHTTIKGAAAAV